MLFVNGADEDATTCAFSRDVAELTEQPYTPFVEDCPIQENYDFLNIVRDRPFNLQEGGYGFLFRSEFFFGQ
jgi:hypothetical protein